MDNTNLKDVQEYIEQHRSTVSVNQTIFDTYFKLSTVLVKGELYRNMSINAKYAYAILEDRRSVSLANNWFDEDENLFFIYTNAELSEILGVSTRTVSSIKKELIEYRLLEQKEAVTGRASRLYLYNPVATEKDKETFVTSYQRKTTVEERNQDEFSNSKLDQKYPKKKDISHLLTIEKFARVEKFSTHPRRILLPNKNNINKTNSIAHESSESHESINNTDYLRKHKLFDYSKQGLPKELVDKICTWTKSDEEVRHVVGLLFKAKASVQKESKRVIVLEELFQNSDCSEELARTIDVVLQKIRTDHTIQESDKYVLQTFRNYFRDVATTIHTEYHPTPSTIAVPLLNWLES